jgi:hypothetical protein
MPWLSIVGSTLSVGTRMLPKKEKPGADGEVGSMERSGSVDAENSRGGGGEFDVCET